MIRLIAALAALALAPAVNAQEAVPDATHPTPAAAQGAAQGAAADAPGAAGPDVAALAGQVEALAEQLAEARTDVAGLKRLKISGYVQPRFGWREDAVYAGGAPSQDGFHVRRGRLKAAYDADRAQYVVQLDATPDGVGLKEAYARLKLPVRGLALDAGLQLMPFGYEVGVRSSADLDLLERATISRTFLKGEYDLGVALRGAFGPLDFRVGLFNGNGVDAARGKDNDPRKDVIGRVGFDLGAVTGGVSGWYGQAVVRGSGETTRHDRARVGADLQVFLDLLPLGGTALKGEYLWGKSQLGSGSGGAGEALGVIGWGWYGILTQNLGPWHQVALRYQQFVPDAKLDRRAAANQSRVFVQDELAAAVHTYLGGNLKLSLAYTHPMNRSRGDTAPSDPGRDGLVAQLQAKF